MNYVKVDKDLAENRRYVEKVRLKLRGRNYERESLKKKKELLKMPHKTYWLQGIPL